MERQSKKLKRTIAFFLCLLVIAVIVIFYGNYKKGLNSTKEFLVVRFETTDIIEFTNSLPITDAVGKIYSDSSGGDESEGYVRFSIENTGKKKKKYQILLTEQLLTDKKISENYIKCYLTDENDVAVAGFDKNRVPTYNDFSNSKIRKKSIVLYSGVLAGNSSVQFRLRMWLSDSYALSKEKEKFRVDVDVEEQ